MGMSRTSASKTANLVCTAIVVGTSAFMVPVSASAEMLVYVVKDDVGTEYFIDVESIKIQGNQVTAWETRDHIKDKTTKHRKSKLRITYYCDSEQFAVINLIRYNSIGGVVISLQVKDFDIEKLAVAPGTVGEEMYKKACASLSQ